MQRRRADSPGNGSTITAKTCLHDIGAVSTPTSTDAIPMQRHPLAPHAPTPSSACNLPFQPASPFVSRPPGTSRTRSCTSRAVLEAKLREKPPPLGPRWVGHANLTHTQRHGRASTRLELERLPTTGRQSTATPTTTATTFAAAPSESPPRLNSNPRHQQTASHPPVRGRGQRTRYGRARAGAGAEIRRFLEIEPIRENSRKFSDSWKIAASHENSQIEPIPQILEKSSVSNGFLENRA